MSGKSDQKKKKKNKTVKEGKSKDEGKVKKDQQKKAKKKEGSKKGLVAGLKRFSKKAMMASSAMQEIEVQTDSPAVMTEETVNRVSREKKVREEQTEAKIGEEEEEEVEENQEDEEEEEEEEEEQEEEEQEEEEEGEEKNTGAETDRPARKRHHKPLMAPKCEANFGPLAYTEDGGIDLTRMSKPWQEMVSQTDVPVAELRERKKAKVLLKILEKLVDRYVPQEEVKVKY